MGAYDNSRNALDRVALQALFEQRIGGRLVAERVRERERRRIRVLLAHSIDHIKRAVVALVRRLLPQHAVRVTIVLGEQLFQLG